MIRRKHVAPNFFGEAEAMRDALDVFDSRMYIHVRYGGNTSVIP